MKKLICKLNGHKFIPLTKNNSQIREYECSCCKQKFTQDGYGNLVKLTKYWKENNRLFELYFENRSSSIKESTLL